MSDDLTVHILAEIRDDVRAIRDDVRATNQRLDNTNQRLDLTRTELKAEIAQTRSELRAESAQVREDLGHRILETEVRLATTYTNLIASNREVYDMLIQRFDLRDRVERCEHEIDALKKHLG